MEASQPKTPKDWFRETSIRLPDGGDTHMHPNNDGSLTVTTRLPGDIAIHDRIGPPPCVRCGRFHVPGACSL